MRNGTAGQARILGALITLGVLFGSSFLCVKVLVGELAPMQVVAGRLSLAAVGVLAVMAVRGSRPQLSVKLLVSVIGLGVLDGVLPSLLIASAETRIDSGLASVLVSTMPLFTVFIASAVLPDERLSSRKLAGLFVGFAGVVVLSGGDALDLGSEDSLGQLAVIGAACSLGAAGVFARILLKNGDPLELTGLKLATSAPIAIVLAVSINGAPEPGSFSAGGIGALLLLGLVNTGPGRVLYFWIVKKSGSVSASLVTYIMPLAGLLLGWLVLGEGIGAATVGGMVLIMAGVVVVMFGESVRIPAVAAPAWLRVAATVVRIVW